MSTDRQRIKKLEKKMYVRWRNFQFQQYGGEQKNNVFFLVLFDEKELGLK